MRGGGKAMNVIAMAVALTLATAMAGTARAKQNAGEIQPMTMGEEMVTASRRTEAVNRVPAHVTVVTAEEIENSTARNVPEVLRALTGIHVGDIGGNQRNYDVDLRGFGKSAPQSTLLLVDGRRINLPELSQPDWDLIPLDRIERIEVIRGSRGSVLYGDNAAAGVINIITKAGRGLEGRAAVEYGSYDTFESAASFGDARGAFAYALSANYLTSKGYRDNSDRDLKDVGLNLRIDPTDNVRLHLSSGYHYGDIRNPGVLLQSELDAGIRRTATTTPFDFDKTEDYYLKADVELDILTDDTFIVTTAFRRRERTTFGTIPGGWFDADTETEVVTISPQFIFRSNFDDISNKIVMGLDYSRSDQNDNRGIAFDSDPLDINASLQKSNTGFFIHDELGVGEHWGLSGGYRYDRATFKFAPADVRKRIMDEEAFGFGLNYAFNERSHVYAAFNRSFRFPVLDEQFIYTTSSVDTSLASENSNNYEVGGRIEITPGVALRLNVFRIETKDEIFRNPITGNYQNMDGKAIRQGIEAGISRHWRNLRMGAGYTFMDTEFDGGLFDGNEVPFVPRNKATAFINYEVIRSLMLGADAIYIGKRYLINDFENEFEKADAYTVVNAKIQYAWRRLTFFVDLNNIFNEKYSDYRDLSLNSATLETEPGFYPSAEFNILAGVRARFGGR